MDQELQEPLSSSASHEEIPTFSKDNINVFAYWHAKYNKKINIVIVFLRLRTIISFFVFAYIWNRMPKQYYIQALPQLSWILMLIVCKPYLKQFSRIKFVVIFFIVSSFLSIIRDLIELAYVLLDLPMTIMALFVLFKFVQYGFYCQRQLQLLKKSKAFYIKKIENFNLPSKI